MAIALIRKHGIPSICNYTHHIKNHNQFFSQFHKPQQQQYHVKYYYSKFWNLSRKSTKEIEVAAPSFFYSSISTTKSKTWRFGVVEWYLGLIKSRPIITKSLTSSFIYVAADLTSQTIALPSSEPYDWIRTLRMAGYGGMILGPTLHYWFNFMSKILPGRDLLTTVKKMALGQTVYGPTMTVIFFSLNAAMQGEDVREICARLKRDLLPTMLNGVMYWPFCDFITFKYVPVHLQPLVSNSFSYLWTVYMTYIASREKASVA